MPRKNPRRNISRVETTAASGKPRGGWNVRLQRRGESTSRFFSDSQWGGNRAALQAANAFRDELEAEETNWTVEEMAQHPSVRNRSGVVGVRLHQQKDRRGDYEYRYWYWAAQWIDGLGRRKTKSFSVHHHGDEEAYRMACEARENGVRRANR